MSHTMDQNCPSRENLFFLSASSPSLGQGERTRRKVLESQKRFLEIRREAVRGRFRGEQSIKENITKGGFQKALRKVSRVI